MTDESTGSATSAPADPAVERPGPDETPQPRESTGEPPAAIGGLWLAVLATGWLAMMVRSVQASLASPGHGAFGVTAAAIGLPAIISAALVGGAGIGLAVRRLFRAYLDGRPGARFAAALGAGFLTGVATAATVVLGNQTGGSAVMVLGGTIAAGATVGGALAGIRAGAVVGAGVAASLTVFLITFVRELFKSELLTLFGAGDDPISLFNAQRWLGLATSAVGGLLAGLVAFAYLKRAARAAADPPRWPMYLCAGAGAGAMLLLTEVITRVGGAQLLALARSISDSDDVFQSMADSARINAALVVFFVGAVTAIIAFGRTLRPADEPADGRDD